MIQNDKQMVILLAFIMLAIIAYILIRCFFDTKKPTCYRKKQKTWKNED